MCVSPKRKKYFCMSASEILCGNNLDLSYKKANLHHTRLFLGPVHKIAKTEIDI